MRAIDIVAVLNTFKPATSMSAKDISIWLSKCIPLSSDTIQNNLNLLVKVGIVIKNSKNSFVINGAPIYYKRIESFFMLYHKRSNGYVRKHRAKLKVV